MLPSVTATSAPEDGVFSRERRPLTLGILLGVAAFATEGMGVVPALPTAVRALGGLSLFGWLFSAFMLAWLVGTIAAGQLADIPTSCAAVYYDCQVIDTDAPATE